MKIADIFTELTAANTQGKAPTSSIILQGIFQQIGKRAFDNLVKEANLFNSEIEVYDFSKNC
jgi:hypothetical protein